MCDTRKMFSSTHKTRQILLKKSWNTNSKKIIIRNLKIPNRERQESRIDYDRHKNGDIKNKVSIKLK